MITKILVLLTTVAPDYFNVEARFQQNESEVLTERKLQNKENLCLGALAYSRFNILETENFDKWFTDESVMELVPAGKYYGVDGIAEYVNFLRGPLFDNYEGVSGSYKVVKATSDSCEVISAGVSKVEMNVDNTRGGKAYTSASFLVKYKYTFTGPESAKISIETVYVHYPEEFLSWFFEKQLNSRNTISLFCDTLKTGCPEVYENNGFQNRKGKKKCKSKFKKLSLVEKEGNVRAYSQGCRNIHASFAMNNANHCPHISFISMKDVNDKVKCQPESDTGRSYDDVFSNEFMDFVSSTAEDFFKKDIRFRIIRNGKKTRK